MPRKLVIAGLALVAALGGGGLYLYQTFVGFERTGLAAHLPQDASAYLSVRHVRKAALALATNDQLQSIGRIAQAIGKTLADATPEDPLPEETPSIDPELLRRLSDHFKTELALAVLPRSDGPDGGIDLAALSYFYGDPQDLRTTLIALAFEASIGRNRFTWHESEWEDVTVHSLEIILDGRPAPLLSDELGPIEPSWAVRQGVLYLASNRPALHRLLSFNAQDPASRASLDQLGSLSQLPDYLARPDLTFHLNAPFWLDRLSQSYQQDISRRGGMLGSLSLDTFSREIGLQQLESLTAGASLGEDLPVYWGIRYKGQPAFLEALQAGPLLPLQRREAFAIAATESLNIHPGNALTLIKDSLLKAAPIANLPYFALRSSFYVDARLNLDSALSNSFAGRALILQTVDTGTGRNARGAVIEKLSPDLAVRFPLSDTPLIAELLDLKLPQLMESFRFPALYEPTAHGAELYVDSDADPTVTTGRFALGYDRQALVLGSGTLKAFHHLRRVEGFLPEPAPSRSSGETLGSGYLQAEQLPSTLYHLAVTFYRQLNPGKPLPEEYRLFDWTALTALEQQREAETRLEPGHLYRVSRRLEP